MTSQPLYKNILQDKLKLTIKEVIDVYFKDRQGKYIVITKHGATWENNTDKHKFSTDKKSLRLAISYLLGQCFCNVGGLTFCQTIGIIGNIDYHLS